MNGRALILAAHGGGDGSAANLSTQSQARAIARTDLFDEVAVAFKMGTPAFADVLGTVWSDDVTVVPLMTSEGYYTEGVLPRVLRFEGRGSGRLRITGPVGAHPGWPAICARRIERITRESSFETGQTAVLVVGHGTRRHAGSRAVTESLVRRLRALIRIRAVRAAFLDDQPTIEDVYGGLAGMAVIVIPFLMGGGEHVARDLPRRLGVTAGARGGLAARRAYIDEPLGSYAEMHNVVLEMVRPFAHSRSLALACGSSG